MLRDKAHENLASGELLLERGHVNAAASRYYYSMYQAAVPRLEQIGLRPGTVRSGALEWDHSMVENNVSACRKQTLDRFLFMRMRRLRSRADYADEPALRSELEEEVDMIRRFVREVTSWTIRE